MSSCTKCGARVIWVIPVTSASPMAFDADQVEGGFAEIKGGRAMFVNADPKVKRYRPHVCPPAVRAGAARGQRRRSMR